MPGPPGGYLLFNSTCTGTSIVLSTVVVYIILPINCMTRKREAMQKQDKIKPGSFFFFLFFCSLSFLIR
ncbi:hypothetical protein HOY80DRAFT_954307 [Tuber brumale]|nr:hypothetical protein HOY80DRAFT_954307 [Tuber brumale]